MTPLEFTFVMQGKAWAREEAEKANIANAWYGAAFARAKKLPDLETMLTPPDQLAEQSPDDMFALLQQINAGGAHMEIVEVKNPWLQQ